jgi:lipoprotein NlpD
LIRLALLLASVLLAGCATTDGQPPAAGQDTPADSAVLAAGAMVTHAPVQEASSAPHKRSIKENSGPPIGYYRIQEGDTLYTIAFLRLLDVNELASWNHIADPAHILAGELLRVTPPVAGAANAVAAAPKRHAPDAGIRPVERANTQGEDDLLPEAWSWPSQGELLARFGEAASKGIDIDGKLKQPVFAAAKGMVVYAGTGLRGYGKLIIIRHGRNLLSAYAHNARILVYEGQSVRRGQQVAEMGSSDTDRVKLHFEIRERGKPVDPLIYLPKAS